MNLDPRTPNANRQPFNRLRFLAALGLAMTTAGCTFLKPAQNESHYYILSSAPNAALTGQPEPASRSRLIRLQPVELADYLATKDIAVRYGTNQVAFALFHRWAEPLDSGIRRVLAEDLRAAPGMGEVLIDQPAPRQHPVCRLSIRVLACEGRVTNHLGSVVFEAAWQITGPDPADAILAHGVFRAKPAAWREGDYGQLAALLSHAIEEFSNMLVKNIREAT